MFMVDYKPSLQRKLDCNEGYKDGLADGFSKGEAVGFSKGEISGTEKGEYIRLIAQIRRKIQKQKILEQISDELEEPADEIEPSYDLLQKHHEKTDEEIYRLFQNKRE